MSQNIYIFDTNIVSHFVRNPKSSVGSLVSHHEKGRLILPEAVIYEVERGLNHIDAKKQLARFQNDVVPMFNVMPIQLADWK